MSTAIRSYKSVLVAVDYFTKWIEAKPLAQPTAQNVENFLWANIVCRYGVPMVIITDNGTPFANQLIRNFCGKYQINLKYVTDNDTPFANQLIRNFCGKYQINLKYASV
ncbi:hypothetical protein AXF42_Ash013077 [Apostasia shenzhenica]|uniref:Integrase catalytic domain-containing protein n=1 Tax=Apostasia shenzhenica TaxID=1088818 RepID=A0A2I0BCZ4_9ASPA|nr:hypothetical protein AXF42_Ash013077 [Apostasia shenzhenica]